MAKFRVKNLAPESSSLLFRVAFYAFGLGGVVYTTWDHHCGVIPSGLDVFAEVPTGDQIEGNLCWEINSSDLDSLYVFVDFGLTSQFRAWFALPEPTAIP